MAWSYLTIVLCFYGFIKEIKIGEPFMYKYQNEYLNLTKQQITNEIYPYCAYAYLLSLIPIFLLTDLLLYKPTMIVEVTGQLVYRGTLIFCSAVWTQKLGQVFYGMGSASEIGFFSYIYAKLEKDQYQKLTSWTRAATMGGRTIGYFFCQFFVLFALGDYLTLNKIAFVGPCIVFIIAIFLPRVHWKQMAARLVDAKGIVSNKSSDNFVVPQTYLAYVRYRLRKMRSDTFRIYKIGFIRKWSFWWAMTTCMSLQVAQYAQALWGEVQYGEESPYNGFAEAGYTATATSAILIMSLIPMNWDKWGELVLVIISTIDAFVLIVCSQTLSIWVMYACYIAYRSLYQVMITIAQWNLAKKMVGESYGLVFGLNSFTALVMQAALTAVISDKNGLGMAVREQYIVYAGCHAIIGMIFLCSVCYTVFGACITRTVIHAEHLPEKFVSEKDDTNIIFGASNNEKPIV